MLLCSSSCLPQLLVLSLMQCLVSSAVAVFSSNMLIVIKNSLVHWMSEAAAECCLFGQLSILFPSFQVFNKSIITQQLAAAVTVADSLQTPHIFSSVTFYSVLSIYLNKPPLLSCGSSSFDSFPFSESRKHFDLLGSWWFGNRVSATINVDKIHHGSLIINSSL